MRRLWLAPLLAWLVLLDGCGGNGSSTSNSAGEGGSGLTLQSIQVNPATVSIAPGTQQPFTATGKYSDGSTKDLTLSVQWSCPVSNLASISNLAPTQGLVTAGTSPGTVVIAASLNGLSNNALLTITNVKTTSLVVGPETASLALGKQQQFTATATFSDMSQQDVTNVTSWSASPAFITSGTGLAIGQAPGSSTITGSFGSQSATASLSVDLSNLTSISVSPANSTIAKGTKLQLTAIGSFEDGSTRDVTSLVTWAALDSTVAKFSSSTNGQVTASREGSTTLTATAGTAQASMVFNVTAATIRSLLIYPPNPSIAPGTKINLNALGVFSDSSVQDLTNQVAWVSFGYTVASVDSKGTATGLMTGSANLTAYSFTSGFAEASTQLNVTGATLKSIAIGPTDAVISPGNTISFTALGTFSDGSTQDVTNAAVWTSSSARVASVNSQVATGQGFGNANISAKLESMKSTTQLSVASPAQVSLTASPSTVQIAEKTSIQLGVQGGLNGATPADLSEVVSWTSSSPAVASVGWQSGIVTGLTPGQSTITASLGSATATIQLKVTSATLTSIIVSPASSTISLGSSQQFEIKGNFSDGSTETLVGATWTSSAPTVAAVNDSGLAISAGTGVAQISATLNGITGSANLTVQ